VTSNTSSKVPAFILLPQAAPMPVRFSQHYC